MYESGGRRGFLEMWIKLDITHMKGEGFEKKNRCPMPNKLFMKARDSKLQNLQYFWTS